MKREKIKPPDPGVYHDVPYDEYDSWDAVRPTLIKQIQKCACMEMVKWLQDHPSPPGPALVVGNATHTLAMEPELFASKYVYVPKTYGPENKKWNWNANICKEWASEQAEKGLTVIRKAAQQFPRPREAVEGMAGAMRDHPDAKILLSGGRCEVSLVWRDDHDGVLCKARLDYVRPGKGGGNLIIDIKTAQDITADAICRASYNFGYQIQAAMGWDGMATLGMEPQRYLFIYVRNKKPYMVNVVEATEAVLDLGRSQYKWHLQEWDRCVKSGEYPGYNHNGIGDLFLPGWAGQELA